MQYAVDAYCLLFYNQVHTTWIPSHMADGVRRIASSQIGVQRETIVSELRTRFACIVITLFKWKVNGYVAQSVRRKLLCSFRTRLRLEETARRLFSFHLRTCFEFRQDNIGEIVMVSDSICVTSNVERGKRISKILCNWRTGKDFVSMVDLNLF